MRNWTQSPKWTKVAWPPTAPVVALAAARDWLGVYGDTSLDAEVQVTLDAAIEKVAANVGYRISDTTVTDHYTRQARGPFSRLQLSEPGIDAATLAIEYYDSDEQQHAIAADEWTLDPTTRENVVRLGSSFAALDISAELENPVTARYETKLANVLDAPVMGSIQQGVRLALNHYWNSRGEASQDPHLLDKSLASLLAAARKCGPLVRLDSEGAQ